MLNAETEKKFDANLVRDCIAQLIPKGYPQKKMTAGTYNIRSVWKIGKLKRVDLDEQNISDILGLKHSEEMLKAILINSRRLREKFTGHLELSAKLEEGKIISLYKKDSLQVNVPDAMIKKLIPSNFLIDEGLIELVSVWRQGDLKEIMIGESTLPKDKLMDRETEIERILYTIRRSRKYFSGRRKFIIKLKNGKVKSVLYKEGNFIIAPRSKESFRKPTYSHN